MNKRLSIIIFFTTLLLIYWSCTSTSSYSTLPTSPQQEQEVSKPFSKRGTISLSISNSYEKKVTKTYSFTDYTFATNKTYVEFKETDDTWGEKTEGLRITIYDTKVGTYTNSEVKVERAYINTLYNYYDIHHQTNSMTVTITEITTNDIVKGTIDGYLYGWLTGLSSPEYETYKVSGNFTAKLNNELIEVEF